MQHASVHVYEVGCAGNAPREFMHEFRPVCMYACTLHGAAGGVGMQAARMCAATRGGGAVGGRGSENKAFVIQVRSPETLDFPQCPCPPTARIRRMPGVPAVRCSMDAEMHACVCVCPAHVAPCTSPRPPVCPPTCVVGEEGAVIAAGGGGLAGEQLTRRPRKGRAQQRRDGFPLVRVEHAHLIGIVCMPGQARESQHACG